MLSFLFSFYLLLCPILLWRINVSINTLYRLVIRILPCRPVITAIATKSHRSGSQDRTNVTKTSSVDAGKIVETVVLSVRKIVPQVSVTEFVLICSRPVCASQVGIRETNEFYIFTWEDPGFCKGIRIKS